MVAMVFQDCLGFNESMQEDIESGGRFDLNYEL